MNKKKNNTLFILGAGASVPYGFPTSKTLRKDIIDNFSRRFSPIFPHNDAFEDFSFNRILEQIKEFQKSFNLSSISSVDYFISRNPRFADLGKDAIILHLLEYEKNCKFREHTLIKNSDWYSHIYNYMISESKTPESFSNISNNNFSFITFNYDRSLEHFLTESFSNAFEGLSLEQLKEIIDSIPIIHVYGKISNIPIHENEEGLKFGSNIFYKDLVKFRKNITTVVDQIPVNDTISEIIEEADRIFFLGFGFDKTNLTNLKIPYLLNHNQKIYGTVLGFNERFTHDLIEYFIEHNYSLNREEEPNPNILENSNIIFEDVDSLTLLEKYL